MSRHSRHIMGTRMIAFQGSSIGWALSVRSAYHASTIIVYLDGSVDLS